MATTEVPQCVSDGTVQLPNGATRLPDGRVRLSDGTFAVPRPLSPPPRDGESSQQYNNNAIYNIFYQPRPMCFLFYNPTNIHSCNNCILCDLV